ncbi:ROK family glucokinase [Fredinandcohnia quinoae]|uniref:Glucokinase n=1 Tax=Fredinandcohnia quinoae TaxID=2918902 RepID=A0AAW5E4C2_9BACI|nr:ROK family glucokinase [Fredinandcohnia sp. SECRCQ15]MCH1624927.1 ROK family glucokinase [Fredinandcohnia sp. SECRCQ15]
MNEKQLIGIDLGGTTIKMAFITQQGEIIKKWEIPTDKTGKTIITDIANSLLEKMNESNLTKDQFIGIGMGAPGPINFTDGIVYETSNLGWKDYPLRDELEEKTGLKTVIDNDANIAAIGEMWKGAGEGALDVICVTLGTGVGGGLISNGEVIRGTNGAGGEIGHMTSIPEGGAPCGCGRTGCLETVASATGIVRLATEAVKSTTQSSILRDEFESTGEISAKAVFDAANAGDKLANEVIDEVTFHLGLAIANVANSLNPEKIVIGGGVSKAGEGLLKPLKDQFSRYTFPRVRDTAEINIATLGNDAGVIGGAYLAKTKIPTL